MVLSNGTHRRLLTWRDGRRHELCSQHCPYKFEFRQIYIKKSQSLFYSQSECR